MLEAKPLTKTISVVLLLITINNVLLLWLLGYFSNDLIATAPSSTNIDAETTMSSELIPQSERLEAKRIAKSENNSATTSITVLSDIDKELKRFMQSETFLDAMDTYQARASSRYMKMEKELHEMDYLALTKLAAESENDLKRNAALGILRQNMSKLQIADLKSLYHQADGQIWDRGAIVEALIEKGDSEALSWGKQLLIENPERAYVAHELLESLYDKDPEFIGEYVGSINLNNGDRTPQLVYALSTKPKLASLFFSNNFDQILSSEDNRLYQMVYGNTQFKISRTQQAELSRFFDSSNRHKRTFAINLVQNIEDTDLLRDSFSQLDKTREKLRFLRHLSMNKDNAEHQSLISEIVASSSNEAIQSFGKQRQ